jgi:hypothetical protein
MHCQPVLHSKHTIHTCNRLLAEPPRKGVQTQNATPKGRKPPRPAKHKRNSAENPRSDPQHMLCSDLRINTVALLRAQSLQDELKIAVVKIKVARFMKHVWIRNGLTYRTQAEEHPCSSKCSLCDVVIIVSFWKIGILSK